MENNNAEKKKKSVFDSPLLSTKVKSANVKIFPEGGLGYFIGPTLALLANSILAGNFNRYMTDVLQMNRWISWFFTWLPVISVIFVVAGNILIGRLMDKSKTRAGKARPLLLVSVPLSILALLMLFVFLPSPAKLESRNTQIITTVLIAIGYNLWFALAYPFYFTSHSALVNLSTRNSKGRSLLATISNATALAAMGLCSMILPFFLDLLFKEGDRVGSYNAWKIFVIALVVITALGVLIEYYFTRERITEESFTKGAAQESEQKKAAPLGKQVKACFKDGYWWIMIVFFFLYQLGGMLKNVSQTYYCYTMFADNGAYSVKFGGQMQGLLSMIGAVPTAVGMVIAWPLSNKIGKGKAILFGAILSVIGGAIGFIAPQNFALVTTSFVIKALGSTPAMYLSLALLADVLDHQEAMHKFRTDGFTMTIYGAIMAGMTGIATGVLNLVLSAVGYDAELVVNGPSKAMQAGMSWLFIGVETICYGVIVLIFIFMGVEKFSKFDHKAIVKDQRAAALAQGVEYIPPAQRLKLEEAEAEVAADEARKDELRKRCEKKGLNFEEEEAKYQKAQAEKQAAADAKKAANDAKKAAAEQAEKARFDALSDAEKHAVEAKKAAKVKKQADKDAAVMSEFNKLRKKYGQPLLEDDDGEETLEPAQAEQQLHQDEKAEPAEQAGEEVSSDEE